MKKLMCAFFILSFATLHATLPLQEGIFLRDAEVEESIKEYLKPIFKVAGLDHRKLRLFLVHDKSANAAATFPTTIFIHTGLILDCDTVGELIGVLAHETAHIASRHVERRLTSMGKMQRSSVALMALGVLAGIATGQPAIAAYGLAGGVGAGMSAALNYSRGQEGSADQSALKYLDQLKWSSKGLLDFLKKLKANHYLSEKYMSPYAKTHPLTTDRIQTLEIHMKKSPYTNKPFPEKFRVSFARIKTKLTAFCAHPGTVLSQVPEQDKTLLARYARTIGLFRCHKFSQALKGINQLVKENPQDPYFHDLKGQILFESGKFRESIGSYEKARKLLPESETIRYELANAYIASHKPQFLPRAKELLDAMEPVEQDSPFYWLLRAKAYGGLGKTGKADWMIAEAEFLKRDVQRATLHANRALKKIPQSDQITRDRVKGLLQAIREFKG